MLVSLLAYAGLRPGEAPDAALGTCSRSHPCGRGSKTGQRRTVTLLEPLAHDLRQWRMASGRPDDDRIVIPASERRGGV